MTKYIVCVASTGEIVDRAETAFSAMKKANMYTRSHCVRCVVKPAVSV